VNTFVAGLFDAQYYLCRSALLLHFATTENFDDIRLTISIGACVLLLILFTKLLTSI
jgi:hypothetical protein